MFVCEVALGVCVSMVCAKQTCVLDWFSKTRELYKRELVRLILILVVALLSSRGLYSRGWKRAKNSRKPP